MLEETPDPLCPLRWTPRLKHFRDQSVSHLLEINDLSIALRRSIAAADGMHLLLWLDDDQLARLKQITRFHNFIPDGFSIVQVQTDSGVKLVPLFVEIDRQTETVRSTGLGGRDWYSKIGRYGQYFALDFRTDPLLEHVGISADLLGILDTPRVLTVTKSAVRVDRMLQATTDAGGKGTYLYTTHAELYEGWGRILEDIWRSPDLPTGATASLESLLRRPLK